MDCESKIDCIIYFKIQIPTENNVDHFFDQYLAFQTTSF